MAYHYVNRLNNGEPDRHAALTVTRLASGIKIPRESAQVRKDYHDTNHHRDDENTTAS